MPQAIEWSFATPKTSALRPVEQIPCAAPPFDSTLRIMPDSTAPDASLRAALQGVRGLLLDMDGVLVARGAAVPGAADAMAELDRSGLPVPGPDQHLADLAGTAGPLDHARRLRDARRPVRQPRCPRPWSWRAASSPTDRSSSSARTTPAPSSTGCRSWPARRWTWTRRPSPRSSWATRRTSCTKENLDRAFRCLRAGAELIGMHRNPWWLTADRTHARRGRVPGRRSSTRPGGERGSSASRRRHSSRRGQAAGGGGGGARRAALRRGELAMVGDDMDSRRRRRAAAGSADGVRSGPASTATRSWPRRRARPAAPSAGRGGAVDRRGRGGPPGLSEGSGRRVAAPTQSSP